MTRPAEHFSRNIDEHDDDVPPDLRDYIARLLTNSGRPPKHDLSTWKVDDDWPRPVPVTQAEVEVFERWFDDVFAALFDRP